MKYQLLVVSSFKRWVFWALCCAHRALSRLALMFFCLALAQNSTAQTQGQQTEEDKVKAVAKAFAYDINHKGLGYITDYLTETEILRFRDVIVELLDSQDNTAEKENAAVALLGPWATADTPAGLPARQLVKAFLGKSAAEAKKSSIPINLGEGPEVIGVSGVGAEKYVLVRARHQWRTGEQTVFVHVLVFQKEEDEWRMLMPQELDLLLQVARSGLLEQKKKKLLEKAHEQSSNRTERWVSFKAPDHWDRYDMVWHHEIDLDSITSEGGMIQYERRNRAEYVGKRKSQEPQLTVMTMQVDCKKKLRGQLPSPAMGTVFPGTDSWKEVELACAEAERLQQKQ